MLINWHPAYIRPTNFDNCRSSRLLESYLFFSYVLFSQMILNFSKFVYRGYWRCCYQWHFTFVVYLSVSYIPNSGKRMSGASSGCHFQWRIQLPRVCHSFRLYRHIEEYEFETSHSQNIQPPRTAKEQRGKERICLHVNWLKKTQQTTKMRTKCITPL